MIWRIKEYLNKTLPQYVSAAQMCGRQLWTSDMTTRCCVRRICTHLYIRTY